MGVASFYHDFREQPAGRHVVKICRAEACQSMGGDAIAEHAEGRLKVGFGETAPDGSVTLEAVYCLGLCACAPAAMVDGKVIGRLDEARIDAICRGGAGMTVTVYVPGDSGALALGADDVARAIADEAADNGAEITIVRNGSRGLYWLEPMVEVADRQRPCRLWPGHRRRCRVAVRCGFPVRRRTCAFARQSGRDPVPQEPDAADLCALRYRRSAVACGLRGAWRAEGPAQGRRDDAVGHRHRR